RAPGGSNRDPIPRVPAPAPVPATDRDRDPDPGSTRGRWRGDVSDSDASASLRSLGVHRIAVPVPFADAGGPVNVYAIENAAAEGGYTLFDSGVLTGEGEAALREGLRAAAIPISSIKRIVVSHGHVDHFGQAQKLSEESG